MGLIFRNRQVAGNICLVVFLAFMFTLLPGQLWTDNAYAIPLPPVTTLYTDHDNNASIADSSEEYLLDPVSDGTFNNTIQDLIDLININPKGTAIHTVTYQKVYSGMTPINWLVYLIYDNVANINYDTRTWVYDDVSTPTKSVSVKVWRPPSGGGSSSPATPADPAEPAVPATTETPATPAVPATPATPATKAVLLSAGNYKPTPTQVEFLNIIKADLQKDKYLKNALTVSNVALTVGKAKISVPKIVITSSKVIVIVPLISKKLDPKAVNYKISVVKNFLGAKGFKNIPVRFVFVNPNPELKVDVNPESYFRVATENSIVEAIRSFGAKVKVIAPKVKTASFPVR